MKSLSRILVGGVAALSAINMAAAADLPARRAVPAPYVMPYNWTGLYVGLNAGANIVSKKKLDFFWDELAVADLFQRKKGSTAFIGGVQVGANYQFDKFVFGVEADIDYTNASRRYLLEGTLPGSTVSVPGTQGSTSVGSSYTPNLNQAQSAAPVTITAGGFNNSGTVSSSALSINGVNYGAGVLHGKTFYPVNGAPYDIDAVNGPSDLTTTTTNPTPGQTVTTQPVTIASSVRVKQSYVGTVRARAGFAWDRALIYATGGLAYGDVDIQGTIWRADGSMYSGHKSSTKVGWTLGAGIEYAVLDNVTLRGEYLYYDLGTAKASLYNDAGIVGQVKSKVTGNIVRLGVNYKFNSF